MPNPTFHALPIALLLAANLHFSTPAMAQQTRDPTTRRIEEFKKSTGVGAQHAQLQRMSGDWKASIDVFTSPDRSLKSEGRITGRPRLGGRFVQLDIEMTMMGRKMNHEVTLGHDNFKKEFDFSWLSDQSTATTRAVGTAVTKGPDTVLTFRGIMHDAMAGKRAVRHVFEIPGEDRWVFTTFDTLPTGREVKVMVITATREQAPPKKK